MIICIEYQYLYNFILQSPPPLCRFVQWIDLEQDSYHKKEVADEDRRKWDYMTELIKVAGLRCHVGKYHGAVGYDAVQ
jgi:hypothetical protein